MNLPSLEEIREEKARRHLVDFVPWATKKYSAPRHLAPLLDCFERAVRREPQFIVCHAPPRHAKTESVLHLPAWAHRFHDPSLVFSYSTYADRLARSKSRKARGISGNVGVQLASSSLNEWRTHEGGGLLSGGVGGPLTGHGVDIAIVDDPVKNRIEAESALRRENNWEWLNDVVLTRIEPGGSCFIFMTRWHPDDLSGRCIKAGWKYICLPALSEDGLTSLWPTRWPPEELAKKRSKVGEYTWESLYQGRPRAKGATVFGPPHTYTQLPTVYRSAFGVDLSYSAKTSSDHSAVVRMVKSPQGKFYVTRAARKQVRADAFKEFCWALRQLDMAASWRWYTSTTETGVANLFNSGSDEPRGDDVGRVPIRPILAKGDKLTRAQLFAAAWNRGDVLIPENEPWVAEFLSEILSFTGVRDPEDDFVDAAYSAFDELDDGEAGVDYPDTPEAAQWSGLAAEAR